MMQDRWRFRTAVQGRSFSACPASQMILAADATWWTGWHSLPQLLPLAGTRSFVPEIPSTDSITKMHIGIFSSKVWTHPIGAMMTTNCCVFAAVPSKHGIHACKNCGRITNDPNVAHAVPVQVSRRSTLGTTTTLPSSPSLPITPVSGPKPESKTQAAPAASSSMECIHRGQEVRTEQCKSCGGNVQIKVFACALHGTCTLSRKVTGATMCSGCPDRQQSGVANSKS